MLLLTILQCAGICMARSFKRTSHIGAIDGLLNNKRQFLQGLACWGKSFRVLMVTKARGFG
jgi:hypothetical protein